MLHATRNQIVFGPLHTRVGRHCKYLYEIQLQIISKLSDGIIMHTAKEKIAQNIALLAWYGEIKYMLTTNIAIFQRNVVSNNKQINNDVHTLQQLFK